MKRIFADVTAFGRQYLRSRVGTFFALAFPVILILLFGSIFSQSATPQVPLYVQDKDATPTSQAFVLALNKTTLIAYRAMPPDVDFVGYIHDHSINVALQIPPGFQDDVNRSRTDRNTTTANVTLAGDQSQSSYGIAASAVGAVATEFNFRLANAGPVIGIKTIPVSVRQLKYIDLFLPGIIGFTVLTTPMFGMTSICAEYRTRRFFKLLATTKLSKAQWLAGKIVFHIVLLYVSLGLMVLTGIFVFKMQAVLTPMALVLVAAGTLEFTSMGMALGIFVRDPETGAAIANAIGFPMMFLAGSFFPVDAMPSFLQTTARFLPLTYVNEGLRATMTFANDATALVDTLITLAFAIVFFIVAARGLSWKSK